MASIRIVQLCALLALSLKLAAAAVDYCDTTLCAANVTHIACNNTGTWQPACPANAALVINTDQLRNLIVRMHNVRRNDLANGDLPGFARARRMGSMSWSVELAAMARLNVRRCIVERDACHNTENFPESGQNVFQFTYTGAQSANTDEELVIRAIQAWWTQYKDATQQQMISFPTDSSGVLIRNFALMAQQENTHVGCAMSRFTDSNKHKFLIACDYAANNIPGENVYYRGATANKCQTGTNPTYPGLCKPTEVY